MAVWIARAGTGEPRRIQQKFRASLESSSLPSGSSLRTPSGDAVVDGWSLRRDNSRVPSGAGLHDEPRSDRGGAITSVAALVHDVENEAANGGAAGQRRSVSGKATGALVGSGGPAGTRLAAQGRRAEGELP